MAANAILPSAGAAQNETYLSDSDTRQLIQALTEGDTSYTISFSGHFAGSNLDREQLSSLKEHVEFNLGCPVNMSIDVFRNTIDTRPLGLINPPDIGHEAPQDDSMSSTEGNESVDVTSNQPAKKAKVPRPPNAFIIYRKEWHARVVAQNPGLHNNAISIIIGRKWKEESQEVKDHYQRKAADAKHQHQLANPHYHYQPRKPSEKKKRMTKTKLARLAAKNTAESHHPAAIQGQENKAATLAEQMELPIFDSSPKLDSTSRPGYLSFTAGHDVNGLFTDELKAHNAANAHLPRLGVSGFGVPTSMDNAFTSDGHDVANLESFPVNVPNTTTDLYGTDAFDLDTEVNNPSINFTVVSAPAEYPLHFDETVVNNSEVFRQADLDDLFDFDSFDYSVSF